MDFNKQIDSNEPVREIVDEIKILNNGIHKVVEEQIKLEDGSSKKILQTETSSTLSSSSSSSSSEDSSSDEESSGELSSLSSLDGGWGWVIVIASFMAHLIADGCCYSVGILLVEWLEAFDESIAKTSWPTALFVSMHAIFGPIASACTNKFGCRKTTIAGGLISSFGCMISIFANSVEMLCITFGVIAGFGLSLVYVPAVVIVAFYFEKKRAFATGVAVAGSGIGGFVFAQLMEWLVERYKWRGAVLIMGGILLNICLCGTLFRPLQVFKKQNQKRRYMKSLERFSRVNSRRQSGEALDRRSPYDQQCRHRRYVGDADDDDGDETCMFCDKDQLEPVSSSLQHLPTYVDKDDMILPPVAPLSQSLEVLIQTTYPNTTNNASMSLEFKDSKNEPTIIIGPGQKKLKKSLKDKGTKKSKSAKKKKTRFPDSEFKSRRPNDVFYRGSLVKTTNIYKSIIVPHSASCPNVFIRSQQSSRSFREIMHGLVREARDSLDISILRNAVFVCFCMHSMMLYVSYDIPYMYIADQAKELDIPSHWSSWLLSIAGLVSTIGQVIIGYIGDKPKVNCRYFYMSMITIAGIATLFVPLMQVFLQLAIYSAIFGFFISANYALTTIIVVDLLGMERLTNAYGFVTLSEGLANLIGVPLAGFITDTTGSYDVAFYLSGIGICISASILFLMPCLKKCDQPDLKKNGSTKDLESFEKISRTMDNDNYIYPSPDTLDDSKPTINI